MSLKDVRRVTRRLNRAILAVAEVVENEQDVEALAALFAALDRTDRTGRAPGATQVLAVVRDTLGYKIHLLIVDDVNHARVFAGLGTLECSWVGGATWDGVAIAKRLAARSADLAGTNLLTGERPTEPVPPSVVAEFVMHEFIACAGLDSGSREWRKTDLRGRGIEPNAYIERHPNPRKTVRWK